MPIVRFEYTANLVIKDKVPDFLKEVHVTLVDVIKTTISSCRSTIVRHEDYVIADGSPDRAFIQLSISMLPGRAKEVKDKLGNQLLSRIKTVFSGEIAAYPTEIRVYLTEIEKDYYYGL